MSTSHESGPAALLRIGDAERLAAVTALGDHFAAGRLNQNELDERTASAFAARTFADLEPLFADLPDPHPKRPAYAAPAPTGWPPPSTGQGWPPASESRPGWPPPWRGGLASRDARMLPAVPFPMLVLGALVLVSLLMVGAAAVAFRAPFLLIPVFWMLCARVGWRARSGRRASGGRRNDWRQDRWR
jgi:hypothetical protein